MNVTSLSTTHAIDPAQAKAIRAGCQFEAILLNTVFGDLQRTFSQLPGAGENNIGKSYDGFGMEALTSGLARGGGIGLGTFIARTLLAHANQRTNRI